MERYFVDFKIHNKENGGWAMKTTKNTDSYDDALKEFHTQCTTYIGGNTFDHVLITMTDSFGNIIKKELWEAKAEPQPEPQPAE